MQKLAKTTGVQAFERTVGDLKQGVDTAAAQTEVSEKAMKTAKSVAAFNQGTLEAYTQATQILFTGSQDLFRQLAETTQAAFAESLTGFRAMVSARTIKERVELQANMVRTSAIWAVSEGSRFAHAGIELAEKVAAPMTARATLAAETFTTKA